MKIRLKPSARGFAAGLALLVLVANGFILWRLIVIEEAVANSAPMGESFPGQTLSQIYGMAKAASESARDAADQSANATIAAHQARDAARGAEGAAQDAAAAARRAEIEAIHY